MLASCLARVAPLATGARSLHSTGVAPQRKLTMSKRRLMMKQKHYCKPGPSIPICILLMLMALYVIYAEKVGKNSDRYLG